MASLISALFSVHTDWGSSPVNWCLDWSGNLTGHEDYGYTLGSVNEQ